MSDRGPHPDVGETRVAESPADVERFANEQPGPSSDQANGRFTHTQTLVLNHVCYTLIYPFTALGFDAGFVIGSNLILLANSLILAQFDRTRPFPVIDAGVLVAAARTYSYLQVFLDFHVMHALFSIFPMRAEKQTA